MLDRHRESSGLDCDIRQSPPNAKVLHGTGSLLVLLLSCWNSPIISCYQAIAASLPCVRYDWIVKCESEGRMLPLKDFLLPYGTLLGEDKSVTL
jgi:hypothetical protein